MNAATPCRGQKRPPSASVPLRPPRPPSSNAECRPPHAEPAQLSCFPDAGAYATIVANRRLADRDCASRPWHDRSILKPIQDRATEGNPTSLVGGPPHACMTRGQCSARRRDRRPAPWCCANVRPPGNRSTRRSPHCGEEATNEYPEPIPVGVPQLVEQKHAKCWEECEGACGQHDEEANMLKFVWLRKKLRLCQCSLRSLPRARYAREHSVSYLRSSYAKMCKKRLMAPDFMQTNVGL